MVFKRFLSAALALALSFTLAACGGEDNPTIDSDNSGSQPSSTPSSEPEKTEPEIVLVTNPLTGEQTLDPSAQNKKPVAVTVNNITTAQKVQTGLDKADVVFETEVEGGITRLLAFFADPTAVDKIGTVRSVRVPFLDIVNGMDGILFYHGIDNDYAKPHMKNISITSYELDSKTYGTRIKNGLASEHTLYTSGAQLDKAITNRKMNDKGTGEPWLSFSDSSDKKAPAETVAKTVSVPFSSSYVTQFLYDEESGRYARARKGTPHTDYYTGAKEMFTNIFILETTISNYPDGYHRKVDFSSGNGYYVSAGGVIPIKWAKGSSENNFKFTNTDGSALTVNQGNSYVCVMSKTRKATFE